MGYMADKYGFTTAVRIRINDASMVVEFTQ
jgi:hypothetical protein